VDSGQGGVDSDRYSAKRSGIGHCGGHPVFSRLSGIATSGGNSSGSSVSSSIGGRGTYAPSRAEKNGAGGADLGAE
jgi:hypothetical protein